MMGRDWLSHPPQTGAQRHSALMLHVDHAVKLLDAVGRSQVPQLGAVTESCGDEEVVATLGMRDTGGSLREGDGVSGAVVTSGKLPHHRPLVQVEDTHCPVRAGEESKKGVELVDTGEAGDGATLRHAHSLAQSAKIVSRVF